VPEGLACETHLFEPNQEKGRSGMGRLLFAAGLAAQHQIGFEVLITIMSLLTQQIMLNPGIPKRISTLPPYGFHTTISSNGLILLGAIGLALTGGEHINSTAKELKRTANTMRLGRPKNGWNG
jgi:hypothetical protein